MNFKSKVNGFSLIEVMISLVILAVGILGISKLQGTLIRSSSDANQRTVAVSIAQQKIDDLKSFAKLTVGTATDTTPDTWVPGIASNLLAFQHIADNEGGTIGQADDSTPLPVTVGNYAYLLSWDVTDYYYAGTPTVATTTQPPGADVDFKRVTVNVAWTDEVGDAQNITLDTVIDSYAPALTALANNTSTGSLPPRAGFNPGVAPEIVYTEQGDLDGETGLRRESTTPNITVSSNNQFVEYDVNFVTYNTNNEQVKAEEFRFINCVCTQETPDTTVSFLPSTLELIFDDTTFDNKFDPDSTDFKVTGKKRGSRISTGQNGQQSDDCNICCRDHHDMTAHNTLDEIFDPFRPGTDYDGTSGDHNHYYPDNSGVLQLANSVGDTYLEACSLVRIDGVFRVTQDFNLLQVKTMPESFLLSPAGFTNYQDFKEAYLLAYAKELDGYTNFPARSIGPVGDNTTPSVKYTLNDPASASVVALTNEPDVSTTASPLAVGTTVDLRSKTLYTRHIPTEVMTELKSVVTGASTWLDVSNLLPFYDPDGTIIAQTNDDTSAWGTAAPTLVSVDQTGALTALAATTGTAVTATRADSNTSFTNTRPIDPNDESSSYLTSDAMDVVVSGAVSPTVVDSRVTITSSGPSGVNPNSVTVTGSNGATCGLEANNVKYVYICSFASGSGRITLSDYNDSYKVMGNTVVVNNLACLSGETFTVSDDGTLTETAVINFSGLTDPVADKTINIVLQSDGC